MSADIADARAFLSHSSKDKGFVRPVFDLLGPTLAELDEATFEPAKFNTQAILDALNRTGLFVLFASESSVTSKWVALEIKEAIRRAKSRRGSRILVYCLDDTAFGKLDPELKDYNVVRKEKLVAVCARQIRAILAEMHAEGAAINPLIARDENLLELKRLVVDPSRDVRVLSISAYERLGRRSLVRQFCATVYPSFTPPRQSIEIDATTSFDDVYRQLLILLHGTLPQAELISKVTRFGTLSEGKKVSIISGDLRRLYDQHEFVQFLDVGGLLTDQGDFTELMGSLLGSNGDVADLMYLVVLFRNVPAPIQRRHPGVAFYRLPPLTNAQAELTILHDLKRRRATLENEDIAKIVALADGEPVNIEYIMGHIFHEKTLNPVRLAELGREDGDFAQWKRGRGVEYVKRFNFSEVERVIVGLLSLYRALPAEALVSLSDIVGEQAAVVGEALARLIELNLVDANGGQYSLIRPLREALWRDKRFNVSAKVAGRFSQVLLENLEQYGANDSVPIALIDAASIASIRSRMPSGLAATFVLPSHFIWLARSAYYAKNYPDSLEYARKALGLPNLMTGEARVEALRWRGLASARLRLESEFNEAMSGLAKEKGARADGNLHFLKGFNHRLRGELSRAHAELSIASRKLRKSIDVERELVGVLIARRDFHAALERARTLITRAEDNPYVLDGYLQAKLGLTGKAEELDYDVEFQKCLRRLREVGHGDGLAFYSLRMCDYNLLAGRKQKALESAVAALDLAPRLPACHAAKVRALVALDELDKAWEAIGTLEGLGRVKDTHRNGFEDLLLFQERFEYNLKKKRFSFCRKDVDNISRIDADLAKFLKTELVGAVLRSGIKIDPELTLWLKK